MAFPDDPLGLRIELQAGGVWTDVTNDVYTRDPITHARGIRNAGTAADPASVPLTLNNIDGRYSPRNPMSPLYGQIGRNTPVRLSLPGGPHFLDLDGAPGNVASTPATAALDITGDIDIRAELETSWYGPESQMVIGKWGEAGQRSYAMRIVGGSLYFAYNSGGVDLRVAQPLPALPARAALRVTMDADNGEGGSTFRHYWAPSLAGPWVQFAPAYTSSGTRTLAVSTAPLTIAPSDVTLTPQRTPFAGKGYRFEVRSGIDGPLVAAPDFTARPVGAAGFTDSAGRVWSFTGTAAVADRRERFVGEVAAWPQRWVESGQDAWTTVEAAGILRRLGQGQKALDSTLRRRIPSGKPFAYWPMEEAREATQAHSPIPGVSPAALTGVEFAATDTLPSSLPLPRLTAAATFSGIVPPSPDGSWQMEMVYNADDKAPPDNSTYAELISVATTGTVRRWVLGMNAGSGRLWGFDASGTDVIFRAMTLEGRAPFHGWVRARLWARDIGSGVVEYQFAFENVGGVAGLLGGTIPGTTGRVTAVTADWGPLTEGWSVGHVSVIPEAASTLYEGSDNAYAGETAWGRITRLSAEEGLPVARAAGP
ncbi:hypothetical protein ACFVAQ_45035, partial [Streptomyces sp. NPDC057651]